MTHDPTHQRELIPSEVHAIHARPRNAARVRLRVRIVVPLCRTRPWYHCGSAPCACTLKYLHDLGIGEWDIEKVQFDTCGDRTGPHFLATATVKDVADRIKGDDGDASQ